MVRLRRIRQLAKSAARWLAGHVRGVLRSLGRGVEGLLLFALHPLESIGLLATFPVLAWRARALISEACGPGLIILTPDEAPLLRTAVTGLGDFTTSIVHGPSVTPGVVSNHFTRVRERLNPLQQALEAALRLHALLLATCTLLAALETSDTTASLPFRLVEGFLRGLAASLLWSLAFRIFAWLLARWAFARLREL